MLADDVQTAPGRASEAGSYITRLSPFVDHRRRSLMCSPGALPSIWPDVGIVLADHAESS